MRNSACVNIFYELIRIALGEPMELSHIPSSCEWHYLYALSKKQALIGICFNGIRKLEQCHQTQLIYLPKDLYLKWFALSVSIHQRNELMNIRCQEVQDILKAEHFKSCILKGQSNLANYPPDCRLLRQSGDIDVWLWCDGSLKQRRRKIIDFARKKDSNAMAFYHHVDCRLFDDVQVELHYIPSWFNNPFINYRFLHWCEKLVKKQMSSQENIISGPTADFNAVYQLVHIYQHLFLEGIGFRQLMDYYCFLKVNKLGSKEQFETIFRRLAILRFASAIMWILYEKFGLDREKLLVEPNEKEGRFILNEIEKAGNFGKYDIRLDRPNNKLLLYLIHTKRNLRFLTHYPREVTWTPCFKLWHWLWRKICLN